MSKWSTLKQHTDFKLAGVSIECEVVDKSIKSIVLTQADCAFKIMKSDSYGENLKIAEKVLGDEIDGWLITAKTKSGLALPSVEKFFDSEWEADDYVRTLKDDELDTDKTRLKVLRNEAGEVVKKLS